MLYIGAVYRSKLFGALVEILREESYYVVIQLLGSQLVLYQNKAEFLDNFEELTPLEKELL